MHNDFARRASGDDARDLAANCSCGRRRVSTTIGDNWRQLGTGTSDGRDFVNGGRDGAELCNAFGFKTIPPTLSLNDTARTLMKHANYRFSVSLGSIVTQDINGPRNKRYTLRF